MRCARDSIPPGLTWAELSYLEDVEWGQTSATVLGDISEGFKAKAKAAKKMKLLCYYEDFPTPPQQECVSFSSQALTPRERYTDPAYRV